MGCSDLIASEDTCELIVAVDERTVSNILPDCVVNVSERYEVWYYKSTRLPQLSIRDFSYSSIPKCYGLMNAASLEESGITRLQNIPTLSLKGQGVFIAVIDTGERVIILSSQ